MQIQAQYAPAKERVTPVSLGNFDVSEDENTLINRLYYAVPSFEDGQFRCSIFFEENTFRKETNGDLTLVHSKYGIDNLSQSELPTGD